MYAPTEAVPGRPALDNAQCSGLSAISLFFFLTGMAWAVQVWHVFCSRTPACRSTSSSLDGVPTIITSLSIPGSANRWVLSRATTLMSKHAYIHAPTSSRPIMELCAQRMTRKKVSKRASRGALSRRLCEMSRQ
ncbi:unnamed protein product [Ectocarpus sp. 4 AP-2014]